MLARSQNLLTCFSCFFIMTSLLGRQVAKWILRNTMITSDHLTPELQLRLLTPVCPMWMARPEDCPFADPYWAFYWPGGQVLARYMLDNPDIVRGKSVMEIGCGCGAVAVAAAKCHASSILANDIDQTALVATSINARLNQLPQPKFSASNFLEKSIIVPQIPDVILLGDMFYDSEMSRKLLKWLSCLISQKPSSNVFIGDPGRHGLTRNSEISFETLSVCALPGYITQEHYGCSTGRVMKLKIS